ncbi:hypothetical protein GLAREA_07186 [Glarea lozoyensis ATCC 20868]|uniref:Uncharacterized protein n=1 Tax=Glarea lozoyensis (strain ATCC 20868 / MF5171) TaxID=1116229 RepID=S3E761_GLAL2|nr:uncharacterized protein GLAREA_07186 [Glarea lozoyensis ATCC 20868]EPE34173.1 hypothetical protein GLAREA_07186 [Glarea lozoyensis ATCC 20868]
MSPNSNDGWENLTDVDLNSSYSDLGQAKISAANAHSHLDAFMDGKFQTADADITSIPLHHLSSLDDKKDPQFLATHSVISPQIGNQTSGIAGEDVEAPTYTANEVEIDYFRPKNTYWRHFLLALVTAGALLLAIIGMGVGLGVMSKNCRGGAVIPVQPTSVLVTTTASASSVTVTSSHAITATFTQAPRTQTVMATMTQPAETITSTLVLKTIVTEKITTTIEVIRPATITATYGCNKATATFQFVCEGPDMKCRRADGKSGGNGIW